MRISRNTPFTHLTVRFMGRRGILRIMKNSANTAPSHCHRSANGLSVKIGPASLFIRNKR